MFLPLHDGVPLKNMRIPVMTRLVIGICIAVYLFSRFGSLGNDAMVAGLGLLPSVLFGHEILPGGYPFLPVLLTPISSIFVHISLMHLGGNMLFLWVFGDNVEDAMGHVRFLIFFILCGVAAGLTHAYMNATSYRPLIGASGGVSGVVAAYLILYPRVRIWALFWVGIPLHVPAFGAIGFWIALQIGAAFFGIDESVGWFAHLGGFVTGALLVPLMRHRHDPILARLEARELSVSR
ncbi:rhomboid family intramembrane serine protease [Microvirga sp. 2MCAF38]|uniref:rhomboid family intramembrane serine protease n=1 Tax=Microvirga sp. 2MCAF38 TaxID=3232989 RepID=UPI003F96EA69